jgi:aminoglycoside phosphotransferase (APT) family kinase protein
MAALRDSGDDLLRDRLVQALSERRGEAVEVVALRRRPYAYETSFAIDRLEVGLGDGETLDLLVKDVGCVGLSSQAAGAKPPALIEPEREIAVYRDLLEPAALSTPRYHGASVDAEEGRWWLFLERVEGEVLTDIGEIDVWCQVAAWIRGLDGGLAESRGRAPEHLLVKRDRAWNTHWLEAALAAADDDGPDALRLAKRLRPSRERLLDRLDALPQTFVHGELYPSNVVVTRGEGDQSARIAPVDWELAGTGPYALDLAALSSGWSEEDRLSIYRAFHRSPAAGQAAETLDDLLAAVALCRLVLALQWIGWSPGWQPPAAQRHDWIAEASETLDEVGLP